MAGRLIGAFFKSVVNAMLMADILVPEVKARVSQMKDDEWYPWDEYTQMVNLLASKLSPMTLRKCGINLMRASEAFYRSQGFQKMDHQMARFDEGFKASVVDAPPEDGVEVVEFRPGYATLRFGKIQPAALIEGYIRGSALIYGATITRLHHEVRRDDDGHESHFFETEWFNKPVASAPVN